MNLKKGGVILTGGAAALVGLGWAGLQMMPKPFARPSRPSATSAETMPIPAGWPAPVQRHYRLAYGEQIPVWETAVFLGRARFRMGLWMRMRFAAYHLLGQNFRRDMEVTWFNLPILKGEDSYLNGKAAVKIRNKVDEGPKIDQGANMMMWAEALMFPTAIDGRARWEAVDQTTARFIFPFGETEDVANVQFDPVTGFMRRFTGLRYKGQAAEKMFWQVDYLNWRQQGAFRAPQQVRVTWADEGTPWFIAELDAVVPQVTLPQAMRPGQPQPADWMAVLAQTAVAQP